MPQAAASVSVMPQPSRCELLATTQAFRYHDTRSSSETRPGRLIQSVGSELVAQRLQGRALVALTDDDGLQLGLVRLHLGQGAQQASKRLTGTSRPTATTSGFVERWPPGE